MTDTDDSEDSSAVCVPETDLRRARVSTAAGWDAGLHSLAIATHFGPKVKAHNLFRHLVALGVDVNLFAFDLLGDQIVVQDFNVAVVGLTGSIHQILLDTDAKVFAIRSDVLRMIWTHPLPLRMRHVDHGRFQAVEVPTQGTIVAGDDPPCLFEALSDTLTDRRGRHLAAMTQDHAVLVLEP